MITLHDVTKRYPDGTVAVGNLCLEMPSGEITVLLGSSGCGKTTTLRMINRLIEPTSGTIELDGKDVGAVPVHELRRGIGYVIQQSGLFPHRTVAENIGVVPKLLGWDRKKVNDRVVFAVAFHTWRGRWGFRLGIREERAYAEIYPLQWHVIDWGSVSP